ncbi:MAG: nucleotidyltransferase domain-containing protein, partial [bacterium]
MKFLIENKEPHSIREISQKLGVDYKNTFQSIKNLNSETYSKSRYGNSNLISFNVNNNPETFSIENKRIEEFLSKHSKIKIIKDYIEELNYPFMTVLIFGSYVKKTNTKISDIDICIISDNNEKKKK